MVEGGGGGTEPSRAEPGRAMGLLNFTREPVPEAVSADLQLLNQLSAQQFSTLVEVLFQFLREPKEVERFLALLSDFATGNKISLGPLKSIVKSLLLVPSGALKRSLTAEQVQADLITLGLSDEKARYFEEQLKLVVKKGSRLEPVYLELTLPQFYSFLHEMERIKTSLESLS
ncbi:putative COMM domain containing 7 protein [Naja naja]|nr:putative COMM domain containing 7 protein [Naja naja]